MKEILWILFGLACKGVCLLMMVGMVLFIGRFFWVIATNGGRKWHYYDPSKPWKGGYWSTKETDGSGAPD